MRYMSMPCAAHASTPPWLTHHLSRTPSPAQTYSSGSIISLLTNHISDAEWLRLLLPEGAMFVPLLHLTPHGPGIGEHYDTHV